VSSFLTVHQHMAIKCLTMMWQTTKQLSKR